MVVLPRMPLDLASLVALRPVLYHLTSRVNLAAIRAVRPLVLRPAAELLRRVAGRDSEHRAARLLTQRRPGPARIDVSGRPVVLRDQEPLHPGHVALEGGMTFQDLVRLLNERVYFWPGDGRGPVAAGRRHFARCTIKEPADCVVLAVPFAALLEENPGNPPLLTACNSGAPRSHPITGPQPRGPSTFAPAERFEHTACDVVEVTFARGVCLPSGGVEVVCGLEARTRGWAG